MSPSIRVAPAELVARPDFFEQLRQALNQVRQSNLPPMKRLFYEQTCQAEDTGMFPEYTAADIARATVMSTRAVSRHHQELVKAKLIRINHYGQGSGKRESRDDGVWPRQAPAACCPGSRRR